MAILLPQSRLLVGLFLVVLTLAGSTHGSPSTRGSPAAGEDFDQHYYREGIGTSEGWFRYTAATPGSQLLPGSASAVAEVYLPVCVLEEEHLRSLKENDGELVLKKTLVVDGCGLDCSAARFAGDIYSTRPIRAITLPAWEGTQTYGYEHTSQESILFVRNGGHLRNCRVGIRLLHANGQLMEYLGYGEEEKDGEDDERNRRSMEMVYDDPSVGETMGAPTVAPTRSSPPTTWEPTLDVSSASGVPTETPSSSGLGGGVYMDMSGIRCDEGDCLLTDTGCVGFRYADSHRNVPAFRSCVEAIADAGTVRIRGSSSLQDFFDPSPQPLFDLATPSDEYLVSLTGIDVAGALRVFVDGVSIRNQLLDGITIATTSATESVRIAGVHIENCRGNGIRLEPHYDNTGNFAILGGTITGNRKHGISLPSTTTAESEQPPDKRIEVFVSDVIVSENYLQGLSVERRNVDLRIEGGVFSS